MSMNVTSTMYDDTGTLETMDLARSYVDVP